MRVHSGRSVALSGIQIVLAVASHATDDFKLAYNKTARTMRNVMSVWRETLSYRGNTMKPLREHREIDCGKFEEDRRPEGTDCTDRKSVV